MANAAKFSPPDTPVTLGATQQTDVIEVSVRDTARGYTKRIAGGYSRSSRDCPAPEDPSEGFRIGALHLQADGRSPRRKDPSRERARSWKHLYLHTSGGLAEHVVL